MTWTTPESVRVVIGLSADLAPDAEIMPYIYRAQRDLLHDVALYVRDDVLTGDRNGVNTTFNLTHKFIADRNFDKTITQLDLDTYQWVTANSISTRSAMTLSTVDPFYGYIVSSIAPASNIEQVTATYYYYQDEIDTEVLHEACSFLAGFYYVMAEYLLIPPQLSHGAYRYKSINENTYQVLWKEYERLKELLTARIHKKGTSDAPEEPMREAL